MSTKLTPQQIDDAMCESSLESGLELIGQLLDDQFDDLSDREIEEMSKKQNIDWANSLMQEEAYNKNQLSQ